MDRDRLWGQMILDHKDPCLGWNVKLTTDMNGMKVIRRLNNSGASAVSPSRVAKSLMSHNYECQYLKYW